MKSLLKTEEELQSLEHHQIYLVFAYLSFLLVNQFEHSQTPSFLLVIYSTSIHFHP